MSNTENSKLLLTVKQAAAETGVCRSIAYELAATGQWPVVRIGRSIRIPREALIEWVRANTVHAAGSGMRAKP